MTDVAVRQASDLLDEFKAAQINGRLGLTFTCDFCGDDEAPNMITAPDAPTICFECVRRCAHLMDVATAGIKHEMAQVIS